MSTDTHTMPSPLRDYLLAHSVHEHPVLADLRAYTQSLAGGRMQISPEQGQLMGVLMRLMKAEKTLEIGTFTGYSALAVALALPESGQVVCCDISQESAEIARNYWQQAGMQERITLHVAPALETLQRLLDEGQGESFDFAFIDADKCHYKAYYELALQLLKPGGAIGVDNVLWYGQVLETDSEDPQTQAICEINRHIYADDRVSAAMIPIGDGLTIAVKR